MKTDLVAEVDRALSGAPSKVTLLAFKDRLLIEMASNKGLAYPLGLRLARINARMKMSYVEDTTTWERCFVHVAKQLLPLATVKVLQRAAEAMLEESRQQAEEELVRAETREARRKAEAETHVLQNRAASSPLKFDPTALFREFGRESVLAVWGKLLPEHRPETAAEFRRLLKQAS